jgi:hypothetical protein
VATNSNERGPARPAFFLWGAILFASLCPSGLANAKPLRLEVERAFPGSVERTNEPLVVFRLTVPSARQFATFTVQNVNKRIEIRVDGIVINKSVIREPILGGMLQVVRS